MFEVRKLELSGPQHSHLKNGTIAAQTTWNLGLSGIVIRALQIQGIIILGFGYADA